MCKYSTEDHHLSRICRDKGTDKTQSQEVAQVRATQPKILVIAMEGAGNGREDLVWKLYELGDDDTVVCGSAYFMGHLTRLARVVLLKLCS